MKTFEEWINIANNIHNNKYKYNKKYKNEDGHFYFEILCNIHGIFQKRISNHIDKKQGCPKCSSEKTGLSQRNTTDNFINKAMSVHNDKYDYSLTKYINNKTKVKIICKIHGEFEQLPCNHLKQNCPKCCKNFKITKDSFIQRAILIHGDKYIYDEVEIININTPVKILCKIHGYFMQKPINHFDKCGCYKCANRIVNTNDFIEKATTIHNGLYNYSKVIYKESRDKIIIICNTHGEFKQNPNDHLNGSGCQKCGLGNHSKVCIKWLENIMNKEKIFIQHAGNIGEKEVLIDNKKYRFDGYCEKNNTVYEFYGDFWHGNPKLYNSEYYHPLNKVKFGDLYNKTLSREELIKNNGYNLINIWESDYYKNN